MGAASTWPSATSRRLARSIRPTPTRAQQRQRCQPIRAVHAGRRNNNFTDITSSIRSARSRSQRRPIRRAGEHDDSESQDDTFLNVQFRHPIGQTGSFSFGPAVKLSHIRDYGDPQNDFTYGEALNVIAPPFGNGGTPTDCANALTTGNFGPSTCAFSLTDDKTAIDYIFQSDYVQQFGKHEIRAGAGYDATRVDKTTTSLTAEQLSGSGPHPATRTRRPR